MQIQPNFLQYCLYCDPNIHCSRCWLILLAKLFFRLTLGVSFVGAFSFLQRRFFCQINNFKGNTQPDSRTSSQVPICSSPGHSQVMNDDHWRLNMSACSVPMSAELVSATSCDVLIIFFLSVDIITGKGKSVLCWRWCGSSSSWY